MVLQRLGLLRSRKLNMNPAVNIVSRVDSPNHAIATCTNIDQTASDMNPGCIIIAREREDVVYAVDPPYISFATSRDCSEGTGDVDPAVGILLVGGIAKDAACRVDPPNRAIRSRAYVGKVTGDPYPGVPVIARVAKDLVSGGDFPDVGARSGGDSSESTGDFNPVSNIPVIAKDIVDGVDAPNSAVSGRANVG